MNRTSCVSAAPLLRPLLWLIPIAAAVLLLALAENYLGGLGSSDVLVYWSYARNLSGGLGLSSTELYTPDLWARGWLAAPVPASRILHPLVIALLTPLFSDGLSAAVFSTCAVYLFTVPLVYLLAARCFSPRAGVLAALLFIFNRQALQYSLWGYSDPLFTLLLLSGVLLLSGGASFPRLALAGLLLGLACLTRAAGFPLLAAFALCLWLLVPAARRLPALVLLLAPALLFPWAAGLINQYLLGAAPLYAVPSTVESQHLLAFTSAFPLDSSFRHLRLPDGVLNLILFDPDVRAGFFGKFFRNLFLVTPSSLLTNLTGAWPVSVLALAGFFLRAPSPAARSVRVWLAAAFAALLLSLCATVYHLRYFYPLLPFWLAFAAYALTKADARLAAHRRARLFLRAAAVLFVLLPLPLGRAAADRFFSARGLKNPVPAFVLSSPDCGSAGPWREMGRKIDSALPPGAPLLSDWYMRMADAFGSVRRLTGMLPLSFRMFDSLQREKLDVPAFLLTATYSVPDYALPEWIGLFKNPRPFLGFRPQTLKAAHLRAVLYTRDIRGWSSSLAALALAQKDPGKRLRLLGLARLVNPRDTHLRSRLDAARIEADALARELLSRPLGSREEWVSTLFRACALTDSPPPLPDLADLTARPPAPIDLADKSRVRLLLSHMPYFFPADGRTPFYNGADADICLRFRAPRHIAALGLRALSGPQRYRLKKVSVLRSVDGFHWTLLREIAVPAAGPDGKVLVRADGLNTIATFLMIRAEGGPYARVRLETLELSGCAGPETK